MPTTLSNIGAQLDLKIRQGSTFLITLTFKDSTGAPLDLTGSTIRAQIRDHYNSDTFTAFSFAVPSPTTGAAVMSLTAAQTALLTCGPDENAPKSRKLYDVEIVDSTGFVRSPLYGNAIVFREITYG